MRITLKDPLVRNRIQERSGFTINPTFWDDTTNPWVALTPSTVDYRVDCLATGAQLADWTAVTPGTTVAIAVKGSYNLIQNDWNRYEPKQVTVCLNRNTDTAYQTQLTYRVDNLYGQT